MVIFGPKYRIEGVKTTSNKSPDWTWSYVLGTFMYVGEQSVILLFNDKTKNDTDIWWKITASQNNRSCFQEKIINVWDSIQN